MARTSAGQNRPSQPTYASVLSVCADATTVSCPTCAKNACAANPFACLTGAAPAVSVFVFFLLARAMGIVGIVPIVASALIAYAVVFRLCVYGRIYSIVRYFIDVIFIKPSTTIL